MDKYVFDIAALIERYLRNDLSAQEEQYLLEVLAQDENKRQILARYKNTAESSQRLNRMNRLDVDAAWLALKKQRAKQKSRKLTWFAYAAAIALLLGVSVFFLLPERDASIVVDVTGRYANDVLPGKNKAILTLSNGKQLLLGKEKMACKEEDGTTLDASATELVYPMGQDAKEALVNTIEVPEGGTYSVVLPDGSRVMLNASSKLIFPIQFTRQERKVSLIGEAYFEIAQNHTQPFKVALGDKTVEVLGTTFNISTYNERLITTLVDGAVRVKSSSNSVVLKPGEEASWHAKSFAVQVADLDKAQAWTKGYFYFDGDNAKDVLEQLSRWYGLELIYKTNVSNTHYSGSIKRNNKLSVVLNSLNDSGNLSFQLDGKRLIVWQKK